MTRMAQVVLKGGRVCAPAGRGGAGVVRRSAVAAHALGLPERNGPHVRRVRVLQPIVHHGVRLMGKKRGEITNISIIF
jgi:hypothetical protein